VNVSYIQITTVIYYISKHFMLEIFIAVEKYEDWDSTGFDLSGILRRRSHSRNCLISDASGQIPKKSHGLYVCILRT